MFIKSDLINFNDKKRVLIIDDEYSCRKIIESIFINVGCVVYEAKDGFEAYKKFSNNSIDLVILDWNMPIRDGRKTLIMLDKLQKDSRYVIPLVLYTGTDPQTINLPHTKSFRLIDFWKKSEKITVWEKSAISVVNRLKRRKI